nr:penicillin-binding transpeptidase domain-containing protein [Fulvivirga sedimenti]
MAIMVKVSLIQFSEGEQWNKIAEQISYKTRVVKATRGNIYSDNGSLLATSLPFYEVGFDATRANNEVFDKGLDSLALLLSRHFGDLSAKSYARKIKDARSTGRQYILLNRRQIGYQEKKKMETWPIFREGRLGGGVIFEKVDKRFRPFNNLSRRTIGFINENHRGAGLEYSFDQFLAGKDGQALYQKMAGGSWRPVFDGSEVKTENGYDIETTIDINLQDVSETALLRALEYHDADYGTVVVMEVKTGEIKAISNLSRNENGSYYERYNHAIGGLMEPGSTFKLVTMMALLEETNISLEDSIDTGDGTFKFYNNTVRDHEAGGYGTITIRDAFEKSSNVAMAKLVDENFGLKPEKYLDYVDELKLSQPLGIQIKGEGVPKIKRPQDKDWSGITLPWMAYGYGFEITPLQTLSIYNAVANNGRLIRPLLVKRVRRADKIVETFEPAVLNRKICSEETLEKLQEILEGVVERGTAMNIKNDHYKIAGKTGTAQVLESGRYTRKYITSFAGYFPADAPKYSAIVVIKNPKGWRQYGSNVAAPVFKEIADNIYARDIDLHESEVLAEVDDDHFPLIRGGVQDELRIICDELQIPNAGLENSEWVKTEVSGDTIQWKEFEMAETLVPDVTGMTLRDALYLLEKHGLRVQFNGYGRVKNQSIRPGTKFKKGNEIKITLS